MGTIVFSLDTETVWGRINDPHCQEYMLQYRKTSEVLHRLIGLFETYDIPVTWAFVGLSIAPDDMLESFIRKEYKNVYGEYEQSWFVKNITRLGDRIEDYSLLPHFKKVMQSSLSHDIGSHTYSHIYMGWQDKKEQKSKFRADLELFKSVSEFYDLNVSSFIYPRNYVREQDLLQKFGYKIYRCADKDFSNIWMRRLNEVMPLKAYTVHKEEKPSGIVALPGSMVYRIRSLGFRRYLPVSWIHKKARKGVNKVARAEDIFHIWLHPFNFAYKVEEHFFYFERLLKMIDAQRKKGNIKVKTMKDLAN